MHKAFLLLTINRVIGTEEIGNQHSLEVAEQIVKPVSIPGRTIYIDHILHICHNPNVAFAFSEVNGRFVQMKNVA
jgi:hypothetical protein